MGTKYSTVSISGYNSSPPSDDASQTAANQVKWSTIKTKLPDPLKTAIEAINTQLVTYSDFGIRQVSTSDTTTAADYMKTVEIAPGVSTSVTVSLGDAATMAAGYIVTVKNSSAINQTVGRATAGNTINGFAGNIVLPAKEAVTFKVIGAQTGYVIESTAGGVVYDAADPRKAVVLSAADVSSNATRVGTLPNYDFRVMTQTKGSDIASAGTLNLDTATGDLVDVTGTTTITAITLAEGKQATVRFTGALTLTNGASLVLPGAANITTVAGDVAVFRGYATGVVRCVSYMPITFRPINSNFTQGTSVASTSGTTIDFTGIPSWVKKVDVNLSQVSLSGTASLLFQLGDSGGIEATGYLGAGIFTTPGTQGGANYTTGFGSGTSTAANAFNGVVTFKLLNASSNLWVCSSALGLSDSAGVVVIGGTKALSGVLDRVRITSSNGTDTFDAGEINIQYQ